ncbi:MAG TPA: DUF1614 domain-containing protein [Methylomirabilota bacterium]
MIYQPIGLPLLFVLLLVILALLVFLIEVRVLSYAYRKIGVSPRWVFAVLVLTLIGSQINIPLYGKSVPRVIPPREIERFGRVYIVPPAPARGTTVVAINVGGALIPILISLYLFIRSRMPVRMLVAVAIVAVIVNRLAQVVPGVGIAVPMFVPPLAAAAVGFVLAPRRAPPLAYVAGSMGALIGADLWNLTKIEALGAPIVSIGGAGTFDGVFLTGIIAGLIV